MVEVTKNFIDQATSYLGEELTKRVKKFHNCGLESFYPEPNKYDCIWVLQIKIIYNKKLICFFSYYFILRFNGCLVI